MCTLHEKQHTHFLAIVVFLKDAAHIKIGSLFMFKLYRFKKQNQDTNSLLGNTKSHCLMHALIGRLDK